MPTLRKYRDRDGFYIITRIGKKIATFQVTRAGVSRLREAGIAPDQVFGRALLLDLYRTGDAYTHGTGAGELISDADRRQLKFDFSDDPDPETAIPGCAVCGAVEDLHLVSGMEGAPATASIRCANCRNGTVVDVSIPLPLVNRTLLGDLVRFKGILSEDPAVENYRVLLNRNFAEMWAALRRNRDWRQDGLGLPDTDGLGL